MATYKGVQSGRGQHNTAAYGNTWSDNNKVTPTATLVATDVVVLLEVPAGVRLDRLRYYSGDFDSATTLVTDWGYRTKLAGGTLTDADFFSDDATLLRAATTSWQEIVFEPFVTTEPIEITITCVTAPTSTSGTPAIHVQASGQVVGIP
jgi:hypothetical protein